MNAEYTAVFCGNDETLCDGYYGGEGSITDSEFASAVVDAGVKTFEDDLRRSGHDYTDADTKVESSFAYWHGGPGYRCGETVNGREWGYRSGRVCCFSEEVPAWLVEAIDAADAAMRAESQRIADKQDELITDQAVADGDEA
jgi:hypothetical protein